MLFEYKMFSIGYESVDGQKVFDLVGNIKYVNIFYIFIKIVRRKENGLD